VEGAFGVPQFPRLPLLTAIIGGAVIAIAYLAFTTGSYVVHYYQLRGDERDLQRQIATLDREQKQLTAVRDYVQSEEYVEEVARRTLGLVRPGETLVIVSGTAPEPAPTAAVSPSPDATPQEWWMALFSATPTVPAAAAGPSGP